MDLSFSNLFAGILFSGIGTAAFIYGKKQGSGKAMILGGLLMVYPWVVTNTIATYAVGAALTAALFVWKD